MHFSVDEFIDLAFLFLAGLGWTAWAIRELLVDLKFYSRNGWDLEKDSGVKLRHGYLNRGEKFSATERFKYGHFIAIGMGFLSTLVSGMFLYPHLLRFLVGLK